VPNKTVRTLHDRRLHVKMTKYLGAPERSPADPANAATVDKKAWVV
jgi:hypothetical protein